MEARLSLYIDCLYLYSTSFGDGDDTAHVFSVSSPHACVFYVIDVPGVKVADGVDEGIRVRRTRTPPLYDRIWVDLTSTPPWSILRECFARVLILVDDVELDGRGLRTRDEHVVPRSSP